MTHGCLFSVPFYTFCFVFLCFPWVLSPGISGPLWSHLFKEGRSPLRFPSPRVVPLLDLNPVSLPCPPPPTFVFLCRAGNFENSHGRQLCCEASSSPDVRHLCENLCETGQIAPGVGSGLDDSERTPLAILLCRSAFSCFCLVLTKKFFFLELLLEEIIVCFESGSPTLGHSGT